MTHPDSGGGLVKGRVVKKIDVFKELTPCLRTYELRGQVKKIKKRNNLYKSKTTKSLRLSYKNHLRKRPPVP